MRLAIQPILSKMRVWDQLAAGRVDKFIANSQTVQDRISKYYGRDSDIINPPVDTHKFKISDKLGDYFLAGGRLVPYKRFDLIVEAFNRTGQPVKIFGIGPDLDRLRAMARPNIEFVGRVSEEEKAALYSGALAYINPQEEDFGITAVEAMAAGRPVIAYSRGGGAETVKPGRTGVWMNSQDWRELADIVEKFRSEDFDPQDIRTHAKQFDVEMFKQQIKTYVESAVTDRKRK
jgi:glycosyltransferase involved in cell wall biosynthesis